MKRILLNVFAILLAVSLTNCLTVNVTVNFPEAEVENAADEINKDIRGDFFEEEPAAEAPESTSWLRVPNPFARVTLAFGLPSACAQDEEPNLKVTNPIIRKINEQREKRAKKIDEYLSKGYVGEGKDGSLHERPAIEALDLMQMAQVRKTIKEENADRKTLYEEFAKINNLPVERVAKVFADSNRKWLKAGQHYQKDNGEWVKKTQEQYEKDRKELKEKGLLD
jgi:uncharacterized protein YdbL (DUF1318 family)